MKINNIRQYYFYDFEDAKYSFDTYYGFWKILLLLFKDNTDETIEVIGEVLSNQKLIAIYDYNEMEHPILSAVFESPYFLDICFPNNDWKHFDSIIKSAKRWVYSKLSKCSPTEMLSLHPFFLHSLSCEWDYQEAINYELTLEKPDITLLANVIRFTSFCQFNNPSTIFLKLDAEELWKIIAFGIKVPIPFLNESITNRSFIPNKEYDKWGSYFLEFNETKIIPAPLSNLFSKQDERVNILRFLEEVTKDVNLLVLYRFHD